MYLHRRVEVLPHAHRQMEDHGWSSGTPPRGGAISVEHITIVQSVVGVMTDRFLRGVMFR